MKVFAMKVCAACGKDITDKNSYFDRNYRGSNYEHLCEECYWKYEDAERDAKQEGKE